MSNTDVWTVDPTVYAYARTQAQERARYQWADQSRWNMWDEFRVTFNNNWFDPWFESETHGYFNGPSTGEGDPAYEITINAYFVYCWMKFKGYTDYSIMAILTSASHESDITGGVWEGSPSHHPYQTLIEFDPTSTNSNGSSYTWYVGGTGMNYENASAYSAGSARATFTNYKMTYVKDRPAGSWARIKQYPIRTYRTIDPYDDGHGMVEVPYGYQYYYDEGDQGVLQWDTSISVGGDGRGYGFVQFTPWTNIPATFAYMYGLGKTEVSEYNKHWQVSGTAQLILWELQRWSAMNESHSNDPDTGYHYWGEWIDTAAKSHSVMGAYFLWPPDGQVPPGSDLPLDIESNRHYYPYDITWDGFAAGEYLQWFETYIQTLEHPPQTEEDIDWCRRQLAMAIWRSCYIHVTFEDFGFRQISKYFLGAIKYWNNNTLPNLNVGWDLHDIPRPRDVPYFELDSFHMTAQNFVLLCQRRRPHNVRTILL